ncbi:hypothetical protein BESB_081580 [Besnoitia besnoiti]|uniref:phosphoinositide 5-phosphatase n=1 Tax=Besnoitia besnoiti TaxID=94643 RepID=A0A2A9M4T2_BESBE|nr:hypothetical protein BESB_081580 [Besnoitia besnoiti]PFH32959.1 hypothetical protein BESB_081580 [Besnoitia besnoiti]
MDPLHSPREGGAPPLRAGPVLLSSPSPLPLASQDALGSSSTYRSSAGGTGLETNVSLLRPAALHPLQAASRARAEMPESAAGAAKGEKTVVAGSGAVDPFSSLGVFVKRSISSAAGEKRADAAPAKRSDAVSGGRVKSGSSSSLSSSFSALRRSPPPSSAAGGPPRLPSLRPFSQTGAETRQSASSASASSPAPPHAAAAPRPQLVFPAAFAAVPPSLPAGLQARWRVCVYRHVFLVYPHPSIWTASVRAVPPPRPPAPAAPAVGSPSRSRGGPVLPCLLIHRRSGALEQHLLPLRTGFLLQQVAPRLAAAALASGELVDESMQPPESFGHFHLALDADALLGTLAVGGRRYLVLVTEGEPVAEFEEEELPRLAFSTAKGDDESAPRDPEARRTSAEAGFAPSPELEPIVGDGRWTRRIVKSVKRAVCLPYHVKNAPPATGSTASAAAQKTHRRRGAPAAATAVVRGFAASLETKRGHPRRSEGGTQGEAPRRGGSGDGAREASLEKASGAELAHRGGTAGPRARLPSLPLDLLGEVVEEKDDGGSGSDHLGFTDLDRTPRGDTGGGDAARTSHPLLSSFSFSGEGAADVGSVLRSFTGVRGGADEDGRETASGFSSSSSVSAAGVAGAGAEAPADALSLSGRLSGIQTLVSAAADSFIEGATAAASSWAGESRSNVTQWMEQFSFAPSATAPSALSLGKWLGDASNSLAWPALRGPEGDRARAGEEGPAAAGSALAAEGGESPLVELVDGGGGGGGGGGVQAGEGRGRGGDLVSSGSAGPFSLPSLGLGKSLRTVSSGSSSNSESPSSPMRRVAGALSSGLGFGLAELAAAANQVTTEFMRSPAGQKEEAVAAGEPGWSTAFDGVRASRDFQDRASATAAVAIATEVATAGPTGASSSPTSSLLAVSAAARTEESAASSAFSEVDRYASAIEKLLCSCFYYSYDFELTRRLQNQQDCGVYTRRQRLPGYADCGPGGPGSAVVFAHLGEDSADEAAAGVDAQNPVAKGERERSGGDELARSEAEGGRGEEGRRGGGAPSTDASAKTAGEAHKWQLYSWKGLGLISVADERFTWNMQLYSEWFAAGIDQRWMVPLVQGYISYVRLERTAPASSLSRLAPARYGSAGAHRLSSSSSVSSGGGASRDVSGTSAVGDAAGSAHETGTDVLIRSLELLLICRRSCRRGGTRYNARGIDDDGNVANFAESEQRVRLAEYVVPALCPASAGSSIAEESCAALAAVASQPKTDKRGRGADALGRWASLVQVRGSVPVFWEQTGLTAQTTVTRNTILTAHAFAKHQNFLFRRYGPTIAYVDLLSGNRSTESRLVAALNNQISAYEHDHPSAPLISHYHYDFHQQVKSKAYDAALREFVEANLLEPAAAIGFFLEPSRQFRKKQLWRRARAARGGGDSAAARECGAETEEADAGHRQQGVLRTNCLDCLDRTNVFQWYFCWFWIVQHLRANHFDTFLQPVKRRNVLVYSAASPASSPPLAASALSPASFSQVLLFVGGAGPPGASAPFFRATRHAALRKKTTRSGSVRRLSSSAASHHGGQQAAAPGAAAAPALELEAAQRAQATAPRPRTGAGSPWPFSPRRASEKKKEERGGRAAETNPMESLGEAQRERKASGGGPRDDPGPADEDVQILREEVRKIWADQGDSISMLYTGTGSVFTSHMKQGGKATFSSNLDHAWKALGRFYQNTFEDTYRQEVIDVFLGLHRLSFAAAAQGPSSSSRLPPRVCLSPPLGRAMDLSSSALLSKRGNSGASKLFLANRRTTNQAMKFSSSFSSSTRALGDSGTAQKDGSPFACEMTVPQRSLRPDHRGDAGSLDGDGEGAAAAHLGAGRKGDAYEGRRRGDSGDWWSAFDATAVGDEGTRASSRTEEGEHERQSGRHWSQNEEGKFVDSTRDEKRGEVPLRIWIGTWNMAGRDLHEWDDIEQWLTPVKEQADVYVFCVQELVELTGFRVLMNMKDSDKEARLEQKASFAVNSVAHHYPQPPSSVLLQERLRQNVSSLSFPTSPSEDSPYASRRSSSRPSSKSPSPPPFGPGDLQHARAPRRRSAAEVDEGGFASFFTRQWTGAASEGAASAKSRARAAVAEGLHRGADTVQPNGLAGHERKPMPTFVKVRSCSMVGLMILVFVRTELRYLLAGIEVSAVKVGMKGNTGNKGAVCVRLSIASSSFCFVDVHLASGPGSSHERMQQMCQILQQAFQSGPSYTPAVLDHDFVFVAGDFNFRLVANHQEVLDAMNFPNGLQTLLNFHPTYKYKKNSSHYDLKRTPACVTLAFRCDRILYCGRRIVAGGAASFGDSAGEPEPAHASASSGASLRSGSSTACSSAGAASSSLSAAEAFSGAASSSAALWGESRGEVAGGAQAAPIRILSYTDHPRYFSSDHKPVSLVLTAAICIPNVPPLRSPPPQSLSEDSETAATSLTLGASAPSGACGRDAGLARPLSRVPVRGSEDVAARGGDTEDEVDFPPNGEGAREAETHGVPTVFFEDLDSRDETERPCAERADDGFIDLLATVREDDGARSGARKQKGTEGHVEVGGGRGRFYGATFLSDEEDGDEVPTDQTDDEDELRMRAPTGGTGPKRLEGDWHDSDAPGTPAAFLSSPLPTVDLLSDTLPGDRSAVFSVANLAGNKPPQASREMEFVDLLGTPVAAAAIGSAACPAAPSSSSGDERRWERCAHPTLGMASSSGALGSNPGDSPTAASPDGDGFFGAPARSAKQAHHEARRAPHAVDLLRGASADSGHAEGDSPQGRGHELDAEWLLGASEDAGSRGGLPRVGGERRGLSQVAGTRPSNPGLPWTLLSFDELKDNASLAPTSGRFPSSSQAREQEKHDDVFDLLS